NDPTDLAARSPGERDDDLVDSQVLNQLRNLGRRPQYAKPVDDRAELLDVVVHEPPDVEVGHGSSLDLPGGHDARPPRADQKHLHGTGPALAAPFLPFPFSPLEQHSPKDAD